MLREEQLDLRRQRAAQSLFRIENLGRNKVFTSAGSTKPGMPIPRAVGL